ncbi:MAG TPA: Gfo/Idh/MocA family oxidoreductase [Clostridiales bacterium]|jgi:myo-inositol 2-dehydrogenase/D-chiro-inositol 1-dehydrogenase|nr:Gfo/Idh/MocA family oxidoreductase [Clostridiales bacterium]
MSFKICTIGCGSMASSGHGPSYKRYAALHKDTVLAACCDLDEEKASAFRSKFGFQRHYRDFELMLDTEKPDAVCLVVPEHLTAPLSVRILENGYPLLMEKPPGLEPADTERMIQAAEKHNTPNQVAFNRRYMPMVSKLKEMTAGEKIHNLRYDFYRTGRFDDDFAATAIHGIDTVRHLAGSDYSCIRFDYQPLPEFGPNVANIMMHCRFESGAEAQLNFSPVSGVIVERAVINSYDNTWFMNLPAWNAADFPGRLVHYHRGSLAADVSGDELSESDMYLTNGFYHENESFFEDIRAGRRPAGDLKSALQSVEISDCIRKRISEYRK